MNNVYNLVLKNFFKNNEKFNNKSFLINANDDISLDKNNESKISSGVYFKLYLSKVSNDLKIKLLPGHIPIYCPNVADFYSFSKWLIICTSK